MKYKEIILNDSTVIIDGMSKLIVLDKEFSAEMVGAYKSKLNDDVFTKSADISKALSYLRKKLFCKATEFTTKRGRQAIKISPGNRHIFWLSKGYGDTSWQGWEQRKPANASFAQAVSNSNGGGCWVEVSIMENGVEIITSEQQKYEEEIG